jgi:hypothetical protein
MNRLSSFLVVSNCAKLNDKYSKPNILITKRLFVNRHSLIRHSYLMPILLQTRLFFSNAHFFHLRSA